MGVRTEGEVLWLTSDGGDGGKYKDGLLAAPPPHPWSRMCD